MSDAVAVALIGGGFTLSGVLVVAFRGWVARLDDIISSVGQMKSANTAEHLEAQAERRRISDKVDVIDSRVTAHVKAATREHDAWVARHVQTVSRLSRIEGQLGKESQSE
jgi:hypothetical protein